MDAAAFEQVHGAFGDFHAYFAPLFGRRETREHSGHYLQALLVQSGERRNAENLSETVPGSARGMQRFLTDSPWDDEAIIGRLQEYLGTRLEHPEGVWVLDGSDFPKQGRKSVGVARQYCGRLGKVANCQAGMFLAYVSPLGRALVDKRLYLPESWTSDKDRCEAAGVPQDRQGYRSKTELALEMVGRAQERGHLKAGWVAADDAFGMSPSFREGLAALGMWYVLDVPSGFTVWPPEPAWTSAEYQGFGRPRKPRLRSGQRRTMAERADAITEEAWREITVAEGSQGPRSYLFSAQRVRPTSRRKPGEIHWAIYRRNLDGSEPRYYLSNAPEDTPLETLAYVGGSRWRIETEFETEKSDVGLDEYETRTWAGWHHHVALCLLGGAFLLSLQQAWGKKDAPDHEPQVYRVVREMLPRERFGPAELLRWLEDTQDSNERARRSHAKRRAAMRASPHIPPELDVVILESYLFSDEVLTALVEWVGKPGELVELLAKKQSIRVARPSVPPDDLKPASGEIYLACKQLLGLTQLGNDAKAFMRDTLAPLIKPGTKVYDELKRDIFGSAGGYASK